MKHVAILAALLLPPAALASDLDALVGKVVDAYGGSAAWAKVAGIEAPYRGIVSAVFRKPFDHAKLRETVAFCAGC